MCKKKDESKCAKHPDKRRVREVNRHGDKAEKKNG
jgi:hypothetical protein